MNIDLTRLKALAQAATPGPWTYFPKPKYREHHVSLPTEGSGMRRALFDDGCSTERPEQDAQFIAAANPAAVLELIERLERAEAALENGRKAADWVAAVVAAADPNDPLDDVLPLAAPQQLLQQELNRKTREIAEKHGLIRPVSKPTPLPLNLPASLDLPDAKVGGNG